MDAYDDGRRAKRRPLRSPDDAGPDLFTPQARKTDPPTSKAAGKKATKTGTSELHNRIMFLFRTKVVGLTDDELIVLYGERTNPGLAYLKGEWPSKSPQRIRTARSDLVKVGLLVDSGQTRTSALGNKSVVWDLVKWHRSTELP